MRAGGVLCALLAVVVTSCGDATSTSEQVLDAAAPPATISDAGAFCAQWTSVRSALTGEWFERNVETRAHERDQVLEEQTAVIEAVDGLVPTEIRRAWDTAADHRRAVEQVLLTVGFESDAIRPVHLEMAFGDADPQVLEAAERSALAAVEEIETWTVTNCGDFCSRWSEIEYALLLPGFGDPAELLRTEPDAARLLEGVEPLVPGELDGAWQEATEWRALWTDAADVVDDDAPQWDLAIEEVLAGEMNLDEYVDRLHGLMEPLDEWNAGNCGRRDGAGAEPTRAGTLQVNLPTVAPDAVGRSMLMLVAAPGSAIWPLRSTDSLVATGCESITWVGGAIVDAFAAQSSSQLCNLDRGERVVLPPGRYDVHVLVMNGLGNGDLDGYLPAPERCVSFPVTVDGDTSVDAPPLEECALGAVAGDPADHPERDRPAVDPTTPGAGTITVRLDGVVSPLPSEDPSHAGRLFALAVEAGTTLSDIGRGEAWPVAAACTMLLSPESPYLGGADREFAEGPVPLPLLAMPVVAGDPACIEVLGRQGSLPDPVLLAPGPYSVTLEAEIEVPGDDGTGPQGFCFFAETVVDGDVVVEAPPYDQWEECP